jgi:hypothetical protein
MLPVAAQCQWEISWHTDEMTDEREAIFSLKAGTLTRTVVGARDRTTLVFRCSNDSIKDAYVVLNAFTPETGIVMRFDRGSPIEDVWEASTDETALFARVPEELLDSLLTHQLFRFRFTPYRGAPETATFRVPSLAGLGTTMAKMCGVNPRARAQMIRRLQAQQADSVTRAVRSITLNATGGLDGIQVDTGLVHLRPFIREVRDNRGRLVKDYQVEADIEMPGEGRVMSVGTDTIHLDPGVSEVTLKVNGVAADSVIRFRVSK